MPLYIDAIKNVLIIRWRIKISPLLFSEQCSVIFTEYYSVWDFLLGRKETEHKTGNALQYRLATFSKNCFGNFLKKSFYNSLKIKMIKQIFHQEFALSLSRPLFFSSASFSLYIWYSQSLKGENSNYRKGHDLSYHICSRYKIRPSTESWRE